MANNNINVNNSDCIKETLNGTEHIYTNVCTGETYKVPIGSWEMLTVILVLIIFLATFFKIISKD